MLQLYTIHLSFILVNIIFVDVFSSRIHILMKFLIYFLFWEAIINFDSTLRSPK